LQCIYLGLNGICQASPPNVGQVYRPDAQTRKDYCENDLDMKACPRLHQYLDFLEASKTEKKPKGKSLKK